MYSSKVKELVSELPNRGILPDATHQAGGENPVCGDVCRLYLKVANGQVLDCRFQTEGCPGAIAAAAAVTQLVQGRSLAECRELTVEKLLDYLEGLPLHKQHGARLALEVLEKALKGE